MEIISKPAGGNKRSSYTYTHTRNRLPSHCKRVRATATDKACPYWLAGNCKYVGDDCKYLHSHVIGGSDITFLTKLVGHDNKPIRGIAFPSHSGTGKLCSAGHDNKLIVWDCQTGQGTDMPLNGEEIGCLLSEGPWLFAGLPNAVRAWNTLTLTELTLDGPTGQVRTLAVASGMLLAGTQDGSILAWKFNPASNTFEPAAILAGHTLPVVSLASGADRLYSGSMDHTIRAWNTLTLTELTLDGPTGQVRTLAVASGMLLAGTQDGSILAWKFNPAGNTFEPAAILAGHTLPVVSLASGADRLYSGSMDHTIRVWHLGTFQCIQTLRDHTSVVMSLLLWDQFLFSCSLDNTVKVWAATSSGALEVTYTHTEQHGVLALCGMNDDQAKPLLLCSCNDNSVRLYDLPSFRERGRVFSRNEVRAFQIGPGGLFFTGDGKGELKVWKLANQSMEIS